MRGFQQHKTEIITITRGDESLDFPLRAPPPGYLSWLNGQFPQPKVFVTDAKGKRQIPDPERAASWNNWIAYLLIAKCLEGASMLSTDARICKTPREWEAYAVALQEEFTEARLTDGELLSLGTAALKLTSDLEDIAAEGKD